MNKFQIYRKDGLDNLIYVGSQVSRSYAEIHIQMLCTLFGFDSDDFRIVEME